MPPNTRDDTRPLHEVETEVLRSDLRELTREARRAIHDEVRYDEVMSQVERIEDELEARGRGEDTGPVSRRLEPGDSPSVDGRTAVLAPEQRMSDWLATRGRVREEHEGLDFGRFVQQLAIPSRRDPSTPEWRALEEGSLGGGGAMVPEPLAAEVIDLARNRAQVFRAGARTVPMETQTLKLAKQTGDPTASWRAENAEITDSDLTFDRVELDAKSLAILTKASRELLEDGNDVADVVRDAFANAIALEFDRVALVGSGSGAEPQGVKGATGVGTTALGAAPSDYDYLIDALGQLQDANEEVSAIIGAPRTARQLAKLKDANNQPLRPPEMVSDVRRLSTNQVPTDLDDSALGNNDETNDFVGAWPLLLMGSRVELQIFRLEERYAEFGQVGFLAWFRGDVAIARTAAFHVVEDIRP